MDYQRAIDRLDELDAHPDSLTDTLIAVYSATEAEDRGGYDDLVARRGAPENRDLLLEAGWAEEPAEMRDEEPPLTEAGAAIYHYYQEVGKQDADTEQLLNEDPEAFARQAFEWWYHDDGDHEAQ